MTRSPLRCPVLLGLLALVLLGLLIFGAPAANHLESGSTWHRGPAGYSAWYESLVQQGVAVQRWQRPVEALLERLGEAEDSTVTLMQHPSTVAETLVVVLPEVTNRRALPALLPWMPDWVEAGHRLVILGVKSSATAAPFSSTLSAPTGPVQINTRRRYRAGPKSSVELDDEYGAVVWQQSFESGQVTMATTPYLGANAYLNQAGNFALLTKLVAGAGTRVWIDEYLHGYRDQAAIAAETGNDSWLSYLGRTPLLILGVQAIAVTLVALLAFNRRLGQRRTLQPPGIDNSQAYIQALAGVLHKAGSHDFVVQTLSQAERVRLQKSMGLGHSPLPLDQLQAAWNQRSGSPAADLAAVFDPAVAKGDRPLRDWLKRLQSLQYPGNTSGL